MIDNFSKYGGTIPVKKNSQTITSSFENILIASKTKPNLIETDPGKEVLGKVFTDYLINNNIKRYSHYTSLGVVFTDMFNSTTRDLLKKNIFERGDATWVDVIPTITKQYNNTFHFSTKLTPVQASLTENEGFVY